MQHPTSPSSSSWPALDRSFIEAVTATQHFSLGAPSVLAVTADGKALFRRTPARERRADLFELDLATGQERLLLSPERVLSGNAENLSDAERARRERLRLSTLGVTAISVSDDGKRVVVPLGDRVFLLDRGAGDAVRELDVGEGYPLDPRIAPTGTQVAFVRDRNLWVAALDGSPARPLTKSEHEHIEYGTAEFVASEELGRLRGYWWSPDGKQLLVQRSDASKVDTLYVSNPRDPSQAPVPFQYPRPGTANVDVTLALWEVASGEQRPVSWDRERYPYLVRVEWSSDGPALLLVNDRQQHESVVLAINADGSTRTLLTDHDAAWVNVDHGAPLWLPGGREFVWMSEQSGDWRVDIHDAQGQFVRSLSQPGVVPKAVHGLDRTTRHAWITAQPEGDSTRTDAYRVPLDGGPWQRLTDGDGWHWFGRVDDGGAAVRSSPLSGRSSVAVWAGDKRVPVPSVAEYWPRDPSVTFDWIEANGHRFAYALVRPHDAAPGKRYPVILSVYGGPHMNNVVRARSAVLADQWLANAGFIVVTIDNRGTPGRGRAWERAILRDLSLPVGDQVAALRAIGAKHADLDLGRVGVTGWSFGGYMAALLTMRHPELFRAGVAGAPVTDWALYDTAYTERYMKLPSNNSEGYAAASVLNSAKQLERPLLLIHGITDDNVHFAHSLALIEALYAVGKSIEVVTLSSTHMVPDPELALQKEMIQLNFFRRHLGVSP